MVAFEPQMVLMVSWPPKGVKQRPRVADARSTPGRSALSDIMAAVRTTLYRSVGLLPERSCPPPLTPFNSYGQEG